MNPNIMECDDHKLKLLLAADEHAVEHDPWMQHVEHCSHCQSRLRELAARADDWQKAADVLAADDDDVPYFGRDHDAPSSWNESMVKQLLEPPSHPEMLGRLGRYEMERMIGCGGMGIVFKAFDTELNRVVAVKLLAPYLAARGSARKRFAREARAAAGVRDDHVVPIFNVESEHEPPFLVMQYVAGGSLQEKLGRDGPLEVSEVLRIGLQTAKGLAAAHAQGLIHRDIKPSNILLDEGVERALLTDFGLARAEDDACLTRSGFHPGTPHYMSPEQVRGEAIDGRSDLFSLGCVLYALCTGHPPFRAETSYAVMRRITDESPRSIREQNANIPEWLEAIVMKLLSKSREDRFASAKEVAELLEDCLAHVHQPATTPLPVGVNALAAQSVSASTESLQANRLKAIQQRIPPIGKFIAAAVFAFALVFAGVVIALELNKGTLTVKSDVEDIRVRITRGDELIDELEVTKTGQSVRVAAGQYNVEVIGETDDLIVENGQVTLHRAGLEVVRIVHNANKGAATSTAGKNLSADQWLNKLQGNWNVVQQHFDNGIPKRGLYSATVRGNRMEITPAHGQGPMKYDLFIGESGPPQQIDLRLALSDRERQAMVEDGDDIDAPLPVLTGIIETDGDLISICSSNASDSPHRPFQFTAGEEQMLWDFTRAGGLSATSSSPYKSSPEYPPVRIVVRDEEGKPLEGVKVSLIQLAKDPGGQVLEINETSNASGLTVNRSLPYGHYDLSARTSDGWVLHHGSRLNVEFEKGLDVVLVAPTANKIAKLVINSDLGPPSAAVNELRFGELLRSNGPGYSGTYAPEPVAKPMDGEKGTTNEGASTKRASLVNSESYDSFPSIVNGIEYVGAEIDFEITRSISQAAMGRKNIHPTWEWYPTDSDDLKRRYLVANNQARGLMDDKDLHLSPVDASQFFELPGPSYRVGASRLELSEPTALPMELDIPAGDVKVYIGRFYGKPNAAALAALNWRQQEKKSELWLKALIFRESAWIERLMNTTGWVYSAPGEGSYILSGHLLRQEASVTAGETLKISLNPKPIDPKTSSASAARVFNERDGSSAFRFESPEALQGEWEFISVESDDVITEYKTPRLRLTVAADVWTVQGTIGGGGHRVEIDGNKLTFHGMAPMMPGLGSNSNDEIPTIGYGLWQVDGDTLTYLMTPAVAESALNGQSKPPIEYPDSFATKGTENSVFRLRRIQASTPPPPSSSTNQTQSKSSIVGHWKVAKLAHLPANELEGATVVIDKGTIKMHVPSQKGPHPHWRYTTGADGEIDLNDFDDAKGDTTSYAKFLLEGKTLYLAVNAKKGDYPRPESARGEPQDGVLYIVLELDELASSTRTVSATDRGDEKLDGKPEVPEQPQLGKTLQQLQGKWRLSRQIAEDGHESGMPSQSVWEFKGDRVIVRDGGPGGAMLIEVDDSQSPVHVKMTIETVEESGLGLLGLEGDKVILCLGKRQKTPDPHSRPEKLQWVAGVFYMELIRMKPGETVVPSRPSVVLPVIDSAISPLPAAPSERHALSIDHGNARSVVEAYVASALAKNIGNAVSLAKNSPADPKRIRELPEFLNVQRLKIETVYINDPSKPTQALATSVAVKLGEEHKNPDGRRDGFMVFTLEFTDDKWFVIDVDFESESGAEKELNKFLKANPNSIGIPPRS